MGPRWQVGMSGPAVPAEVAVVLSHAEAELARARGISSIVPIHELLREPLSAFGSGDVVVTLPTYRGKRFVDFLSWVVFRGVGRHESCVTWRFPKREARSSVALLHERGWKLTKLDRGQWPSFTARPPIFVEPPLLRSFVAEVRGICIRLEADFGVFSPEKIDAGSRLLLDTALEGPPVGDLADVGIGYGAVALPFLVAGHAKRAFSSDVDSVALWLAEINASNLGVALDTLFDPDPALLPPTELTVCNIPTHVPRVTSEVLIDGLARRARAGRLLAVVHRSLATRYERHFLNRGLRVAWHPGAHHTVLEAAGRVP